MFFGGRLTKTVKMVPTPPSVASSLELYSGETHNATAHAYVNGDVVLAANPNIGDRAITSDCVFSRTG